MSDNLTRLSENLFHFADICNVYLIVDGDNGLVIDAGSGAILAAPARPAPLKH